VGGDEVEEGGARVDWHGLFDCKGARRR
jgi:hypothetical protein